MGANYVKIHEIMPKKMLGKTIKFHGLFMAALVENSFMPMNAYFMVISP